MLKSKNNTDVTSRVSRLVCWSGNVTPMPLNGGITNSNFIVQDGVEKYVVRVGEDLPLHGILRTNELAVSQAAHAVGLGPEIVYHEPGILVMRFIKGPTLCAKDVANKKTLERLSVVLRVCHTSMKEHLPGATPMFRVFQVCQNYLRLAREGKSRVADRLDWLETLSTECEETVGAIEPVFCHNDLLPANFIEGEQHFWLIDWEYAGWNSALFDLANLSSNCELSPELEHYLLKTYYEHEVDTLTIHRFHAFKCASLLRETLWSLVQEIHSKLDFDYAAYTDEQFARLEISYSEFKD